MARKSSTKQAGNQMQRNLIIPLLAGLVLLLTVFSGLAVAQDEGDVPNPDGGFPAASSAQDLANLTGSGGEVLGAPETDPVAADALPHTDLTRDEAEELLTAVFPTALTEQAGVYSDLEVKAFHSDYVAVVEPPDSSVEPAGLLSSLLPLRTEAEDGTKEVVNLDLEHGDGGMLQPVNPLVDLEIPTSLQEAISLPDVGISINLDVPDRSASVIAEGAAFYPNVADQSDLTVVPIPTGVETFTQLRSSEAPRTQRYTLDLPVNASLEPTADGGAVVRQEDASLLTVRPPSAIDAEGNAVPVEMHVDSDDLVLHAMPDASAHFPILIDPVFEAYSWKDNNSTSGIGTDWISYRTPNQSVVSATFFGIMSEKMYAGLTLRSNAGAISPGTSSNHNYYVPRYFSDYNDPEIGQRPVSFIRNMQLSQVNFLVEENPSVGQPYAVAGLWNEGLGTFHTSVTKFGNEAPWTNAVLTLPNNQENTNVKNGGIGLASYLSTSYKRQLFVGQASVEVSEREDAPEWSFLNGGGWTHNSSAAAPISFRAGDEGLGVRYVKLTRPLAAGGSSATWTSFECAGNASSPCPAQVKTSDGRPITYDPGAMAQGESAVTAVVQDAVGNESAPSPVLIKVDHDRPLVGLSGNLNEQATVGTKLAKYTLNYSATDGDSATAAALTPVGSVGTGTGQIERPFGIDVDAAGNIWIADTTNNRVVELDKNGTFIRQITSPAGVAFKEIRGLAVAPNGSVFVADKGNHRVVKLDANGQFVWAFATGTVNPFDLAVTEGGIVWVTDPDGPKVYRYKENGTLESTFSIPQPWGGVALPFGIDVDEFGNGWIAVQGSNQILELSPSGSQLFSFGTSGSGTGQFNSPFDVSIAPSGNLFVSDSLNHRIQEFKPDGSFLRTFGASGIASNQLSTPKNIAVAPGNKLVIADYGNKRVARWEHADQDPQSGVTKVQIKVPTHPPLSEQPRQQVSALKRLARPKVDSRCPRISKLSRSGWRERPETPWSSTKPRR